MGMTELVLGQSLDGSCSQLLVHSLDHSFTFKIRCIMVTYFAMQVYLMRQHCSMLVTITNSYSGIVHIIHLMACIKCADKVYII